MKVRSFNNLDHTCFTDSTYVIHALGRPHAGFTIYPGRDVCAAETVILQDTSSESIRRDWIFYDYVDGQVVDSTIVRQGKAITIPSTASS